MTRSIVIADSSSLMALDNIGEINVLPKLFAEITVTPEVAGEIWPRTSQMDNYPPRVWTVTPASRDQRP